MRRGSTDRLECMRVNRTNLQIYGSAYRHAVQYRGLWILQRNFTCGKNWWSEMVDLPLWTSWICGGIRRTCGSLYESMALYIRTCRAVYRSILQTLQICRLSYGSDWSIFCMYRHTGYGSVESILWSYHTDFADLCGCAQIQEDNTREVKMLWI